MSEAILKARARALARPVVGAARRDRQALLLRDGDVVFAVDLDECGEVHAAPPLTPLPLSPPQLAGLALVRGRVVACFRFATGEASAEPKKLVLIGGAASDLAFVVDDASRVVAYDDADVAAVDGDRDGLPVRGVLVDGHVLLDGAALLRDPRFFFPAA
jgi:chemotaxis signal transduction protein